MDAETAVVTCRPNFVDTALIKQELLAEARRRGFQLAGIAAATPAETAEAYREWLEAGHAGQMGYLGKDPERRSNPRLVWPETGSILVVGINYHTWEPAPEERGDPMRGQVARYALGDDYHDVLTERLRGLLAWARERWPETEGRSYVDTGPLLERDLAARAGLGWWGKNTMLLNREQGSYFFLGAVLLNLPLTPDAPTSAHCGSCSRCLNSCPTGAFVSPYVLDARRCIAYLTIELKGAIPRELRPLIGNWAFGCDVCQEVCPWNRKAAGGVEPAFQPRPHLQTPELVPLLSISQEEFSAQFKGSPIKRTKRRGLLRNVCVALGNSGDPAAVPALIQALRHEEPLVRGHAAWALGQLGGTEGRLALEGALPEEEEPWVREELEAALCAITGAS